MATTCEDLDDLHQNARRACTHLSGTLLYLDPAQPEMPRAMGIASLLSLAATVDFRPCPERQAALLHLAAIRSRTVGPLTVWGSSYASAHAAALQVALEMLAVCSPFLVPIEEAVTLTQTLTMDGPRKLDGPKDKEAVGRLLVSPADDKTAARGPSRNEVEQLAALVEMEYATAMEDAAQLAVAAVQAEAEPEPEAEPNTTDLPATSAPEHKGKYINERMFAEIASNPEEALRKTVRDWARQFECSISTVAETYAWEFLEGEKFQRKYKKMRKRKLPDDGQ